MASGQLKIAVVGGGVAGITASYLLQRKHEVTLFEKNDYLGGHTNTIVIKDGPDAGTPVDTGFIVLNDKTYPLLHRLLKQLNVPVRTSDMSFSFYNEKTGMQFAGTGLSGIFSQKSNLFRPSFWKMLKEIRRFGVVSKQAIEKNNLSNVSMGDFLKEHHFSQKTIDQYIIPMGSAIWSTSPGKMLDFPAETLLRFFNNHGLLSLYDIPQWQTVASGSHAYVKSFLNSFQGTVHLNARIDHIKRTENNVSITFMDGKEIPFDCVVMAAHADESLQLLQDPSPDEKKLLGSWNYEKNVTVLHTDDTVLSPNKKTWASWNYVREKEGDESGGATLTYHMNRLQGLETHHQYFVTLNRIKPIPQDKIIREFDYTHPTYTFDAIDSQKELPKLNGVRNTYFCGSYFGYGFHEDAVRSGVEVARAFGLEL